MTETEARSHDSVMAASGSGHGCPEGVPVEFALLSILAAFGVAFGVLYRALTLQTGGRRRRRASHHYLLINTMWADIIWSGSASVGFSSNLIDIAVFCTGSRWEIVSLYWSHMKTVLPVFAPYENVPH